MTFRFGFTEATILVVVAFLTLGMLFLPDYDRPPIESVQNGFRGTGMAQVYNPREVAAAAADHQVPEVQGLPPLNTEGPRAIDSYQNIQVLGDLSTAQFLRLMTAITAWVSPEQGCNYCHVSDGFQYDDVYAKRVSRWMLHMVRDLNNNWASHTQGAWEDDEGGAGVNCWTCHRGLNVPEYVWYTDDREPAGALGYHAGQNIPGEAPLLASLPSDPFSVHLTNADDINKDQIRVQGDTALPSGNRSSTKQAELTYSLMMHMSGSLGVNCTYCHNSRAWGEWEQSTPQRTTAWYGLQMTQALNSDYIIPSLPALPEHRIVNGNPAMTNCGTCHQGVYKPLYGADMISDWPSLTAANYVDRETLEPGLGDVDESEAIGARLKEERAGAEEADAADAGESAAEPETDTAAAETEAPADDTAEATEDAPAEDDSASRS